MSDIQLSYSLLSATDSQFGNLKSFHFFSSEIVAMKDLLEFSLSFITGFS